MASCAVAQRGTTSSKRNCPFSSVVTGAGQFAGTFFNFLLDRGPMYQPRELSSSPTRGQLICESKTLAPFTGSPLGVKTLPSIG